MLLSYIGIETLFCFYICTITHQCEMYMKFLKIPNVWQYLKECVRMAVCKDGILGGRRTGNTKKQRNSFGTFGYYDAKKEWN